MPPGAAWESAQDSNQLPSYRLTSTHSWHLYTCVGKQLKRCYVSSLHHLCWVSPRCVCEQGKMLQPSQVSTRNFVSEGATDIIFHFIFWEICKLWPRLPWCMWAPKLRNMCLTRGYPSIGPKVQKEVSEKCPIQIYFPTFWADLLENLALTRMDLLETWCIDGDSGGTEWEERTKLWITPSMTPLYTTSDSVQWFDIFTKADKNQETICCRFCESVGSYFLTGLWIRR